MAGGDQAATVNSRHPELVSGPIFRFARSKRGQAQSHCRVRPMRVALVDQVDLPLPMPALELFFARDGQFHCANQLEMDESVDAILGSEAGDDIVAMLPQPAGQIGSDADLEGAVVLAGKDVDARLALFPHAHDFAAKWALKQVQDDDNREGGGFV